MRNTFVRFSNIHAIPDFTALGDEIVVRIDHEKRSELFVVSHVCHGLSPAIVCRWNPMPLGSTPYR
jgi:hypothetical protein